MKPKFITRAALCDTQKTCWRLVVP